MSNGQVSKPYFVSISGKNVDDNMAMLNHVHAKIINEEKRIAGVELNHFIICAFAAYWMTDLNGLHVIFGCTCFIYLILICLIIIP